MTWQQQQQQQRQRDVRASHGQTGLQAADEWINELKSSMLNTCCTA
jgi:hypothetical protein